ncbi:CBS domain-containing protein [Vibrio sp. WXL103]|uniref:CBS domain-containing protein n=1 Tax=Vibrio sp. WXL103 TaxID=3450710 RepID=UPI003EC4DC4A
MSALLTVRDIVNSQAPTFSVDTSLSSAIDLLIEHQTNGAPVLDAEGQLVGFLSAHDVMVEMWCQDYLPDYTVKVGHLMKTDVVTMNLEDRLTDALEELALDKEQLYPTSGMGYATQMTTLSLEERAKSIKVNKPQILPVLDQGQYVGVVSRQEVLKALRSLFNDSPSQTTEATAPANVA